MQFRYKTTDAKVARLSLLHIFAPTTRDASLPVLE